MLKPIALLTMFLSLQAHADISSDIALLRTLAPAGQDVAQIQTAILRGNNDEEAIKFAQGNYLIRDFNRDGINDALVIFEVNPVIRNEAGQTCPAEDYETGCFFFYGGRSLHFFVGQADGSLTKVSDNSVIVLGADEGGVFGEPLEGLSINKKGSVSLNFYGGSAWRWSYGYTFQFRGQDFYLIGTDSSYGWNVDGRFESTSINLLTGVRIDSSAASGDAPVKTKKSRIKKQPLVSLSNVKPINE